MNIATVMDEMGAALATIAGLNVFPFSANRITPPAVIVGWPDPLTYDATLQRGKDRFTLPLYVVVGKVEARSARDRLAVYLDGAAAGSVKAALERHTFTTCDSVRVTEVRVDAVTVAGVEYLGAIFQTDVIGPGGS
ncbi:MULTISPECIES: hypothetical protein [Actinomycetes]|uniref:DUF3168 domain-containing protein n=2 Tax=Actinomycetes TaxID=1760 RepID=A0A5N8X7M3_9ACTN|nr:MULTISPECIES: hypothetical protein [Actinomycetes]MPY55460.1 hypothetical protein [Streptomyces acidicola]GHF30807.1 hypothetical protein GCM10017786_75910 [Amycolatopsis deserti]